MRILYVEDNPTDAALTRLTLERSAPQHQLETARNIREALDRLRTIEQAPIDLVLTDVHLPDGDGLSLLTRIRETAVPVAVVVVTGVGDEALVSRNASFGAKCAFSTDENVLSGGRKEFSTAEKVFSGDRKQFPSARKLLSDGQKQFSRPRK